MVSNANKVIENVALKLSGSEGWHNHSMSGLIDRDEIIDILDDIMYLVFAGYFESDAYGQGFAKTIIYDIYERLSSQVKNAFMFRNRSSDSDESGRAKETTLKFIDKIPEQANILQCDVKAHFDGDPAASSCEEIILSYPGLYAIFVHRFAHVLYTLDVPFIPRIMSEYAHAKTGIDINPGAKIGKGLFIDHGTGVVIGETAEIGNNVQIYQGVTLGALSPRHGQVLSGSKRHPTVEDDVTIYANATVLGGNTIIGKGTVISGNTTIVRSVKRGVRVSAKIDEPDICEICTRFNLENQSVDK